MESFLHVIPYVYKHSSSTEMGLRQSIINVWSGFSKEVKNLAPRERLMELMTEYPELGGDLIAGLSEGTFRTGARPCID